MAPITVTNEGRKIAVALGVVIRQHRERLGVSQEEFAEMTGHHRTYIGFLERGERVPNVQTIAQVAKALKVKPSQLLSEAGF